MAVLVPEGRAREASQDAGAEHGLVQGLAPLATRGPGCAPGLPSALGQAHDSEHRPNRRSAGSRRLSAEKNRARGPLRLFIINTHRAGRLSRHPSINPSGWSPTAPARRRLLFDRLRPHKHGRERPSMSRARRLLQGLLNCADALRPSLPTIGRARGKPGPVSVRTRYDAPDEAHSTLTSGARSTMRVCKVFPQPWPCAGVFSCEA